MESFAIETRGNFHPQMKMEEPKLSPTPTPQPSTSVLQNPDANEKLMELSFMSSSVEEKDRSSFGLLPSNLLFEFANMNSSANSLSFLMNKSRKYSCLPPIPESPKQLSSPTKVEEDNERDNAASDGNKEAVKSITNVPGQFDSQKCVPKFSISDLSKIEFCDDQISARSSSANTYDLSSNVHEHNDANDTSMPSSFSHLFSRHSLDVSAFTTPGIGPKKITSGENIQSSEKKFQTNSPTEIVRNEELPVSNTALNNQEPSKGFPQFFYNLGNEDEFRKSLSQGSDEFIQGVDALNMFEKDEEIHLNDNFLLLPQVANEEANDIKSDNTLGSSWLANINRQDITRPSWFTSEDGEAESRISIGRFISARAEDIGALDHEPSSYPKVPSFASDAVKLHLTELETASLPTDTTFKPVSCQKNAAELSKKSDNILSSSAISMLISDASVNASPNELAKLFLKAAFLLRKDSCDNSGSSTPVSLLGNENVRSRCVSNENVFSEASTQELRLINRMEDKVVQVSFEGHKPVNVQTSGNSPICISLPSTVTVSSLSTTSGSHLKIPSCIQGDSLLKPLRVDPQDSIPAVMLPSEIEMDTCCVGASVESSISLQNLSARWLESSMLIQKLTCNGQDWDLESVPPIIRVTPPRAIEPQSVHKVKILLIPPTEGCWEAVLQFFFRNLASSSHVTTSTSPVVDWCSYPPLCLTAKAESPSLSIVPDDVVDFGMLPEECLSVNHIQLSNNGKCKVPVRLVMEGSPVAGQGFYFPQDRTLPSSSVMEVLSSCLTNCVLQSSMDEMIKIPIAFKAPALSHTGDDTRAFSACLRIELDTPGPSPVLGKVSLRAIVGIVRLYTRPEDETISLKYPSLATKTFPLKNAGAVSVNVAITPEDSQRLTVVPKNIVLMPGEQMPVQVTFHPPDIHSTLQSFIKIEVLPSGPMYKISVHGNCHPSLPSYLPAAGDHSALYSNRRYIYYGVANLGQSLEQRLILRNVSASEVLHLNMKIKVDDSNNDGSIFLLKSESLSSSTVIPSYKLVLQKYATLHPGDEHSLIVVFAPKAAVPYSAKLIIRPQRGTQVNVGPGVLPGVKFTVPLRGYGGIAILSYSGLNSTGQSCPLQLSIPSFTSQPFVIPTSLHPVLQEIVFRSDQQCMTFGLRNSGQRAAFLRILLLQDTTSLLPVPSYISASVYPSAYVLSEQSSVSVKITAHVNPSYSNPFYALIVYGEEILRQRFRLLSPLPTKSSEETVLWDYFHLHDIFINESPLASNGSQPCDPQWPSCQGDRSELLSSLKFLWIRVQPNVVPYPSTLGNSVGQTVSGQQTADITTSAFVPLVAEATFSDVTFMPSRETPLSPPIKEKSPLPAGERFILVEPTTAVFPRTSCGSSSSIKITLKNIGCDHNLSVGILRPANPFHISHGQVTIKPKHYISLPVHFRPKEAGIFSSSLLLHPQLGTYSTTLAVSLQAEAF